MYKRLISSIITCCFVALLTACGANTAGVNTEEAVATASEPAEPIVTDTPTPTPTPVPSYTISFEDSNNESIEGKEGEEAETPEYKGKKLTDIIDFSAISVDDEGYYCIGTDRVCPADRAEIDKETKTINLKNINIPYQVRYVVNTEDDTVYPIQLIQRDKSVGSGICVSLTYEDKEDGTRDYAFKGLTDMIARPIDNAEIYRGVFKGWSEEQASTEAEYEVGNKVGISKNITLYPIFDTEGMDELAVAEGSDFKAIINDTKDIVATAKWGNISVNDNNRVVTDQASSTVDQESGKVYAKELKTGEQKASSTQKENNQGAKTDPDFGSVSDEEWAAAGFVELDPEAVNAPVYDPYGLKFE